MNTVTTAVHSLTVVNEFTSSASQQLETEAGRKSKHWCEVKLINSPLEITPGWLLVFRGPLGGTHSLDLY